VDVSNDEISYIISQNKGKIILVNVWATWCKPCREEFPDLIKLKDTFPEDKFSLLLISADFDVAKADAIAFLEKNNVDFLTYRKTGSDMDFINVLDPEWAGSLPGTFLFDSDGEKIFSWYGKESYDVFVEKISKYVHVK